MGRNKMIDVENLTNDRSYLNFLHRFWKNEFNQNEKLSHNIVNKILYSKRLLVDHVDSLEQCLPMIETPSNNDIFTFYNTSLIVASTVIQKFVTPNYLRFTLLPMSLFTSGFCCFYLGKKVSDVRLKYIEGETENLINSIDKFGSCIKRNITYFNEILVMKTTEFIESRQIERAWDCMTTIKDVVDILYGATRKLEENYKLPARFSEYYFPMEELRHSDFFVRSITEYNPRNIKDFYNIFAYVQSQFLLRLAFTVSQNSSIEFLRNDVSSIEILIRQHVYEEEEHFMNLSIELKRKQQLETSLFHTRQIHQIKSGPVAVLQESSLKLSACIIAVAEECQKLDIVLQKINSIDQFTDDSIKSEKNDGNCVLEIANSMRSIENSLSICCNDFQRLMLVYNKFLGSKLKADSNNSIYSDLTTSDYEDKPEKPFTTNQFEEEKKDDFYAYIYDENSELDKIKNVEELGSGDSEFNEIQLYEKVQKKQFKPVLAQLKEKINPIRENLLEKERQILKAKGIDLNQLLDYKNAENLNENMDEMDEISRQKHDKKSNIFEERRNYLSQKLSVNLFGVMIPQENIISEEILE